MPQVLKFSRRRRKPAHRADVNLRHRLASVGGILVTTAIIGTGAFLGLASVDGTYASLTGTAQSNSATVQAGEMTLSVGGGSNPYAIPASSNLFPGDSVMHSVLMTVANKPATLSADISMRLSSAPANGFVVRVKPGTCPAAPFADGVLLSTTDQSIGTWGGAQSSDVCVQVSLPATVPNAVQSKLDNLTILVTAKQP